MKGARCWDADGYGLTGGTGSSGTHLPAQTLYRAAQWLRRAWCLMPSKFATADAVVALLVV